MAQQLILNIYHKETDAKPFAAIYYHWSAYTVDSLEELDFLVKTTKADEQLINAASYVKIKALLDALHKNATFNFIKNQPRTCGGLTQTDYPTYKQLTGEDYIQEDILNRNCGILAISQKEINHLSNYALYHINWYIDDQTFMNDCIHHYDEDENVKLTHDLTNLPTDTNHYFDKNAIQPISQLTTIIDYAQNLINHTDYYIKTENNKLIQIIA